MATMAPFEVPHCASRGIPKPQWHLLPQHSRGERTVSEENEYSHWSSVAGGRQKPQGASEPCRKLLALSLSKEKHLRNHVTTVTTLKIQTDNWEAKDEGVRKMWNRGNLSGEVSVTLANLVSCIVCLVAYVVETLHWKTMFWGVKIKRESVKAAVSAQWASKDKYWVGMESLHKSSVTRLSSER